MKNFYEMMEEELNLSVTENGAIGHKSTFNPILDMNFRIPSYRNDRAALVKDFRLALDFNRTYAMKWAFYLRDVRGGAGERQSFRTLVEVFPDEFRQYIKYIAEFGRWDDVVTILKGEGYDRTKQAAFEVILSQLKEDVHALYQNEPVSLLGKWLPSENTSSSVTRALAKSLRKNLGISPRSYRKLLTALRQKINIVEAQMSSNNWSKIEYEKVPSRANALYSDAFLAHDVERRSEFIKSALEGKVNINASAIFPHELLARYMNRKMDADSVDAQWKNLPNLMNDDESILVVRDGSGSMFSGGISSSTEPIHIATALAIYCSERLKGPFNNKFITFSSKPSIVKFNSDMSFHEKVKYAMRFGEISNTNLEATFELILQTAISHNLPREEMVKNVLIISDMEFDSATTNHRSNLIDTIKDRFATNGYKMPNIIFWNVAGRTNTIPSIEKGVTLVSGFSQYLLKVALGDKTTPWEQLQSVLDSDRYSVIS